MRTEDLIGLLAQDDRPPARPAQRLVPWMAGALALSALVGLSLLGLRPDLVAALQAPVTAMKWLLPLAVGGAGLAGALHLTRPDREGIGARAVALAVVAGAMLWLALALLATPAGQVGAAVMGQTAPQCLLLLTALGLPALAAALAVLRDGASVAPARSGAMAGLAAGGFATAVYALHCPEDAPQFFLVWYSLGIAILVAAGAAAGSRLLRW
jgi:hypothetical protein